MRKFSTFSMLVLCASVFLIACNKDDDSSTKQARLLVANAVITPPLSTAPVGTPPTVGPSFDVRWDGQFIIPNVIYGAPSVTSGSPFTTIGNNTTPQAILAGAYANVKSGAFGLNFTVNQSIVTVPPANAYIVGSVLYDRTTSFLPGRSYSAIAFDFNPLYRVMIIEDDLSAPPAGKVKVRFVHAVPPLIFRGLPVVPPRIDTIDVTGFGGLSTNPLNNVALFPTRNFGDAFQNTRFQQFAVLDSGSYRFGLRVAGTPGTSAATGALGLFPASGTPLRLIEGKIYTIIARMHTTPAITANQLGQPGLTLIQHN